MTLGDIDLRSETIPPTGGQISGPSPLAAKLDVPSLLVREAVQNSWDARDPRRAGPVRFSIEGWDVDGVRLDDLRRLIPTDGLSEGFRRAIDDDATGVLHPGDVLAGSSVRILVMSDRRTVGLCGPTRGGEHWQPALTDEIRTAQPRFVNFIRNQGRASSDVGVGDGGSYGVGKSIFWRASTCGTVLVHTRSTDSEGREIDRFIGAIHGDYFFRGKRTFTGRHFIGEVHENDLIEPLTGSRASEAARLLGLRSYAVDGEDVRGTSIVVIAPQSELPPGLPSDLWWELEMVKLRDAVRWQVWPKRVEGLRPGSDGPDMEIDLSWNNNPVEIPDPLEDPEVGPYAETLLDCVRNRSWTFGDEKGPVMDHTIECRRPIKKLGLLKFRSGGSGDANAFNVTGPDEGLVQRLDVALEDLRRDLDAADADLDLTDLDLAGSSTTPGSSPWGHIALIRNKPFLLVRYESIAGTGDAEQTVGVFLSDGDPEVEEALTLAEPPAHNEWIVQEVPKTGPKDHRRTYVKRTLAEIDNARRAYLSQLAPPVVMSEGSGEQEVSKKLTAGLPGGIGGKPHKKPAGAGGPSGRSPKAEIRLVGQDQLDVSRTAYEIEVTLPNSLAKAGNPVRLTATGTSADSDGSMSVDDRVVYTWVIRRAGEDVSEHEGPGLGPLIVDDTTGLTLRIVVSGNIVFRPKVGVVSDGA